MFKEFKAFIAKGNVMDMAVGIIIGAAFHSNCSLLWLVIILMPDHWHDSPVASIFLIYLFTLDGNSYATIAAAEEAAVRDGY